MTASEPPIDFEPSLSPAASPSDALVLGAPASGETRVPVQRPSFLFLGVVSAVTLFADIATKAWAEVAINRRGFEPIEIIDGYLSVILAYNRGGAWGLLHNASEMLRRPFFLCVSAAAILFIVSLYAKLVREQKALTWGLPLVLGGALGNLSDRISRSQVIDFIDYHADWVLRTNAWIKGYVPNWTVTDHWPTFNVADIAICLGVGLMAIDMMGPRRRPLAPEPMAPGPEAPFAPAYAGAVDTGAADGALGGAVFSPSLPTRPDILEVETVTTEDASPKENEPAERRGE
jgi:signal peptidase II